MAESDCGRCGDA